MQLILQTRNPIHDQTAIIGFQQSRPSDAYMHQRRSSLVQAMICRLVGFVNDIWNIGHCFEALMCHCITGAELTFFTMRHISCCSNLTLASAGHHIRYLLSHTVVHQCPNGNWATSNLMTIVGGFKHTWVPFLVTGVSDSIVKIWVYMSNHTHGK